MSSEADPSQGLGVRLNNWVKERGLKLFSQQKVRRNIVKAVDADISYPVESSETPPRLLRYRQQVEKALTYTIKEVEKLPRGDNGLIRRSSEQKDSRSQKAFYTELVREDNAWVTREFGEAGTISKAVLYDDGKCTITLSYEGDEYSRKNADPSIISSTSYPTASKVLFLNHAASLGIIGWDYKTKKKIDLFAKTKMVL